MEQQLEVQGLDVQRNGAYVLQNLSFHLARGEFLAVIGPNGAGKSTLIKALVGLVPHQSGTVQFGRQHHRNLRVGYVPQSRQIHQESPLSTWDFVSFGLPNHWRPWLTRQERAAIHDALVATDCLSFANRPLGKLSGGQRQRVYLSQALVQSPNWLLLDEPTSNLDPGAQRKIVEVVARVCKDQQIGVLFVTHDVNVAAKYADRVLYISRGKHAIGKVSDIMNADVLSALYGTPMHMLQVGSEMVLTAENGVSPSKTASDEALDSPLPEGARYVSI